MKHTIEIKSLQWRVKEVYNLQNKVYKELLRKEFFITNTLEKLEEVINDNISIWYYINNKIIAYAILYKDTSIYNWIIDFNKEETQQVVIVVVDNKYRWFWFWKRLIKDIEKLITNKWERIKTFLTTVHPENIASIKSFEWNWYKNVWLLYKKNWSLKRNIMRKDIK